MTSSITKKRACLLFLAFVFVGVVVAGEIVSDGPVLAQEEEVFITETAYLCEEVEEIELPGLNPREGMELRQNLREVPIGRSTDFTEKMAEDLIDWSLALAVAAQAEVDEAQNILATSRQCGESGVCESRCELECDCECEACDPGDSEWDDPDEYCAGPNLILCCPPPEDEDGFCYCKGCLDREEYDLGQGACSSYCSGCDGVCCCVGGCINAPCEGNCSAMAASMRSGIEDVIIPQAQVVDHYFGLIERTYFYERFYPLLLYNEQYGIFVGGERVDSPTNNQVASYLREYLDTPSWLEEIITHPEMVHFPGRDWEDVAMGICIIGGDAVSYYCINPLDYHTSVEKTSNGDPVPFVYGYLDKSRIRMSECVSEPYLLDALLREEKGLYGFVPCRSLGEFGIITHSFIAENGLDRYGEPLEGEPIEGCYGYIYGRAMEVEGIEPRYPAPNADDFYCCDIYKSI